MTRFAGRSGRGARWRAVLPAVLLAVLVVAISVLQYRWLGDLARQSEERMRRDLRAATLTTAAAVDVALSRLAAAVEAAPPDSFDAVLAAWDAEHPDLAGLIGSIEGGRPPRSVRRPGAGPLLAASEFPGGVVLRFDSLFLASTLVPRLATRIAESADLEVALSLRRDTGAGAVVLACAGASCDRPGDVTAAILAPGRRVVFIGEAAPAGEPGPRARGLDWSAESAEPTDRRVTAGGFELRATHAAGSLERAAAGGRRRNLALGLGLMLLLTLVGATTLRAFRRNARLAEDRATILAGISHEIRTPLAVIHSAAENLRAGVVGPDAVAEYGALIEAHSDRLAGTVANAVAFARAADRSQGDRERVDLALVAQGAADLAGEPGRIVFSTVEAAWCRGDAAALAIAVRNLIANALDYSGADGPVAVTVGRRDGSVYVAVADRGPGISPDEAARIFEPFARGRAGTASSKGGLGLGLALAYRVAALHGGSLSVATEAGGGSRFTLSLPGAE
ncbi:MAG: sensor histidine kinase [Gemmatimonadales bacterium]